MQIIITDGAGFLGQRLCTALLKSELKFDEILLVDINLPENPEKNSRVRCQQIDLSQIGNPDALITEKTSLIFHLAAIVSSHAEKDFDLGWRVNLEVTRLLLEACRHARPGIRFIFSSSSLKRITNSATLEKVQFIHDASIDRIVSSWPGVLDNSRALQLGFPVDSHFDEFIKQYLIDYNIQAI